MVIWCSRNMSYYYQFKKQPCCLYFCGNHGTCFSRILWWIENSKEQHSFEIDLFFNMKTCFIHQSIYTCLYGPNWWHLTISYIHINGHVSHDIDCCVTLLSFLYMPCFHIALEVRTSVWPPSCNPCFSVEIWGHKPLIICSYINRCVCAVSLSDDWTELQWCSPPGGWTNKLQGDYRSHSCGESIKGYCIQGPKAPHKCVD